MVQTTIADVVGPAIAADDPDALATQVLGNTLQFTCQWIADGGSLLTKLLKPLSLLLYALLARLIR